VRLNFLAESLNLTYDAKGGVVFEGDRAKPARNAPAAARGEASTAR
jgi:hypothetical protein